MIASDTAIFQKNASIFFNRKIFFFSTHEISPLLTNIFNKKIPLPIGHKIPGPYELSILSIFLVYCLKKLNC